MRTRFWTVFILVCWLGLQSQAQTGTALSTGPGLANTVKAEVEVRAVAEAATLSLKQAVALALESDPLRKAALADEKIAAAGVRQARAALMPHLLFSESALRGTDPVYAFGTRLRQGRFTADDFALNRLNHPTPLGNFVTRLSGQWNVLNVPDWLQVRRAEKMTHAAAQQLDRTGQQTVMRVLGSYFNLLMAARQQELSEQQLQTARSVLALSRARYESGTAVEADYLAAQVNEAMRQMELVRARNAASLARLQFTTALGFADERDFKLVEQAAERHLDLPALADSEARALHSRPDLKQLQLQGEAAEVGRRMAKSALAPRVSAFGGWEQDNPAMFSGGSNNWTAGIELQFDLFTGGQKSAQLQQARATSEKLAALQRAAADEVRIEVHKAWFEADTLRQQIAVMQAAVAQTEEGLRITQTRYQSGLSTITELLRAEESRRRTQTEYWQTLCGFQTALANLELATGTLSPGSSVVVQ